MRVRGTIHGEIPGGIADRPLGAGARRTGKDLTGGPGLAARESDAHGAGLRALAIGVRRAVGEGDAVASGRAERSARAEGEG